jgi:alpha-methylacyl-CoA racemase
MTAPTPDTAGGLPLAGLKIVELHAIGPVPFAGQLLRSLGAEVTRVSPPTDPGLGVSSRANHDLLNFGKPVVTMDLKSAEGQQTLAGMLAAADVMLEGFRPGVLERLGLAPATLAQRFPRLVVGRLNGWGLNGPYADRAGHDINYLGLTGLLNAIGAKDAPVPPLNLVADFGGGAMHLAVGVLAKLVQRSITGRGGCVETSILAGTVSLSPIFYGLLAAGIWQIGREINLLDGGRPYYRVYRTKDDRFVSVGALEPKFYRELLRLMGLEGEIDPAKQNDPSTFAATQSRFEQVFATRTRDEWGALAQTCDCCMAPVLDFLEATQHPHNLANGLYVSQPIPQPAKILDFDRGFAR